MSAPDAIDLSAHDVQVTQERGTNGLWLQALIPELPGCVAVAATAGELEIRLRQAVILSLERSLGPR